MSKNKVKKFSIIDKKLIKFINEDNVQSDNNGVSDVRDQSQTDK